MYMTVFGHDNCFEAVIMNTLFSIIFIVWLIASPFEGNRTCFSDKVTKNNFKIEQMPKIKLKRFFLRTRGIET